MTEPIGWDEAEVIETIARAMCETEWPSPPSNPYEFQNDTVRGLCQRNARAAIVALRPHLDALRAQAWRDGARAARDEDKACILGGRFLSEDAPVARWARELDAALDRLPLPAAPEREP